MKRIICLIMVLAFAITWVPTDTQAAQLPDFSGGGYDISQYDRALYWNYWWSYDGVYSQWDYYYTADTSFAYVQFIEKIKEDSLAQAKIGIATLAVEGFDLFGLDRSIINAEIQYYEAALLSLLATSEMNLRSAIASQEDVDNTMEPLDYLVEACGVFAGSAGFLTGGMKDDAIAAVSTLISGTDTSISVLDVTRDSVETQAELDFLRQTAQLHLSFDMILNAILDYQEPVPTPSMQNLKIAARNIKEGLLASLKYKLLHFDEWFRGADFDLMGFVFGDVLDSVLDNITEFDAMYLDADDLAGLKLMSNAAKLMSSISLGSDIAVMVCDLTFGASDLLLRYYEICAMAGVRQALLQKADVIRNRIDGLEDSQQIMELVPYLYAMLYVNARGEYSVYSAQTSDAKLYTVKKYADLAEDWYEDVQSLLLNCEESIERLLIAPDDYYRTDEPSEFTGRWIVDTTFTESENEGVAISQLLGSGAAAENAWMTLGEDGSFEFSLVESNSGTGKWLNDGGRIRCTLQIRGQNTPEQLLVLPGYTQNTRLRLMTVYGGCPIYWMLESEGAQDMEEFADYLGSWQIDEQYTMSRNGVSMWDLFGSAYSDYGSTLTIGADGSFNYAIGAGNGGSGSWHSLGSNLLEYEILTYESQTPDFGTITLIWTEHGEKRLVIGYDTYSIFWKNDADTKAPAEVPVTINNLTGIWYCKAKKQAYLFESTGFDSMASTSGIHSVAGTCIEFNLSSDSASHGGFELTDNQISIYSSRSRTDRISLQGDTLIIGEDSYKKAPSSEQSGLIGTWGKQSDMITFTADRYKRTGMFAASGPYYVLSYDIFVIFQQGDYFDIRYSFSGNELHYNDITFTRN